MDCPLYYSFPNSLDESNRDLQKTFENYKLIFHERSVSDYGNSQLSRKRLLIIGVHRKTGKKYLNGIAALLIGSVLVMDRNILLKATARYLPAIIGSQVVALVSCYIGGKLIGFGAAEEMCIRDRP